MRRKQYPNHNGPEEERGFTAEEIRRGFHLLYVDLECPHCGFVVSLANLRSKSSDEALCPRCGGVS